MELEFGRVISHPITISPSDNNGFVVTVGCGTFVSMTVEGLLDRLGAYLKNPKEYEKKYNEMPRRENRVIEAPPHPGDEACDAPMEEARG